MATPEDRNARNTSVSACMGGASRGISGEESCRRIPNYLRPRTGSCHDKCKEGMNDEFPLIRWPATRFGSRKRSVVKNKRVKRTVIPVERKKLTKRNPNKTSAHNMRAPAEPVEIIKMRNSLPSKRVGVSKHNRNATQNGLKIMHPMMKNPSLNGKQNKKDIKTVKVASKPASVQKSGVSLKGSKTRNYKLVSSLKDDQNGMTKTKLKQLIAEKVQEKTAELGFVPTADEIIRSLPTLTTDSTNVLNSESSPVLEEEPSIIAPEPVTSSEEQVLNLESEPADEKQVLEEEYEYEYINDEEGIILEDDDYDEIETSEGKIPRTYKVVLSKDKYDDSGKLKFRRGKVLELQSDDDNPRRLKFRRGKVLEDDCKEEGERVNLKHQEVQQKKDAQELLNNVIEETASKLVEGMMKTKVEALVGAFETVISLKDEKYASDSS